jgi:DNA-binding transcriptional LysR family regulator
VHTAARGHGVALADRLLARDEIVAGRLIRPFAVEIPMGGYWLVTSDRRAPSAPAERFSAWLRERISAARSEAVARDHH